MTGFEPATSWSQTKRSSQAELHSEMRRLKLCITDSSKISIRTLSIECMATRVGFEPTVRFHVR